MSERFSAGRAVEIVESLQGMQILASKISDRERKRAYIQQALGVIAPQELLDHNYMVDSLMVMAKSPNLPDEDRIRFDSGMLFMGRAISCNYIFGRDAVVDSLTIDFDDPEVLGIDMEDSPEFQILTFQVPVLAIDNLVLAEAA